MDGEFVRRKSSRWGNSSKPRSSLFSSRGFTPPEQQIPVEIPEEIPEPVFLKSVLNSRSKESPLESEQENVKEQGDVSLKSDALEPTDGGELIAQANTPEKSQQDKSKGAGGWLSKPLQWVWGVVQGDFNEDPSISQTVVRTLITLIPGIDQAGDVQDLTAALYKLAWKQQYDEIGPWFDLFITGIGFVPELGSVLKGVIKILKKGEDANVAKIGKLLGGLANNLDDFSAFTDIAAKSVKQKISSLIAHTTQTASALRLVRLDPTGGKIKQLADKLDNFAQSLEEIRGLVDEKFREIGWEIQRQLDELLGGQGKLATANGAPLPGKGVGGIEPGPMRIEGGTGDKIGDSPSPNKINANSGIKFPESEGVYHVTDPKDKSLLSSIRGDLSGGKINLGKQVGEGGFGTLYEVSKHPNLLVKVATKSEGKPNEQLIKEAANLSQLSGKGYPTVYKGLMTWVDSDGITKQGIVMEKVEGALSKHILRTGKFANEPVNPSLEALVTQKTIEDLNKFLKKAENDDISIEDLQFMISAKDGSIHLIDPARVEKLPSKGRQRKELKKQYIKRINRIIKQFSDIAANQK